MKLIKNIYLVVFLFVGTLSFSQELSIKDYIIEGEDTILLTEVPAIAIISFTDPKERIKYRILKRRVLKVYPYAIYTKKKMEEIEVNLGGIKRKIKKKRYTKEVAKFLKEELGEKMKKLTKKEGNILVKLIYRETQMSTYKLLKQYRGGVNAFFWQTMAILYDNELKQEYDTENVREDMFIEHIIIQAKLEGKLE